MSGDDLPGLCERIEQRLAAMNLSAEAASKKVTGSRDLIRMIKRGHEAGGSRLAKLAEVLQCSLYWLITGRGDPDTGEPLSDIEREALRVARRLPLEDAKTWVRSGSDRLPNGPPVSVPSKKRAVS